MGYTHFDGISVGATGLAVGTASAGETQVISSTGAISANGAITTSLGTVLTGNVALSASILQATTAAAEAYIVAPIAGAVTGYTVFSVSAGTGRLTTVTVGSAGAILLETAVTGVTGTIGTVVTMSNTSGTTAVAAGQSILVGLASCATAQVQVGVTLVFTPTA